MKKIQVFIALAFCCLAAAQNQPSPASEEPFGIDPIPVKGQSINIPTPESDQIELQASEPELTQQQQQPTTTKETQQQQQQTITNSQSNQKPTANPEPTAGPKVNIASNAQQKPESSNNNNKAKDIRQERIEILRKQREEYQKKKQEKFGNANEFVDDSINTNQRFISQQTSQFGKVQHEFQANQNISKHTSTVTFELGKAPTEFYLQYFSNMPVYVSLRVLIEDGNTFKLPDSQEQISPMTFTIYEDATRTVVQQNIYFVFGIIFDARKGVTYTLNFKDNSKLKELIEITFTSTIPKNIIQSLIQKEEAEPYITSINELSGILTSELAEMRKSNALDFVNARTILQATRKFSTYQFVEMVLVIVVTVLQLQLIKRLFKTSSIL